MRIMLAVLALALLAPAAHAGGWATAGLNNLPVGVDPGEEWKSQITLMQHGRTPLEGVKPAIVVTDKKGTETRFDAVPSGKPGVYDVTVVFPAAGEYAYTVDDGFGNAYPHTFPAAVIGGAKTAAAPSPVQPDDGAPVLPWLLAGAAILLGAGAFALRRRRGAPGGVQPA